MREKLTASLQENCITILCHSDQYGKVVAGLIDPNLFEGEYRVVAERAIGFWQRHNEAPKFHTPDLVSEIIEDRHNRKAGTYRRILTSMMELSEHVNTDYVLDQLRSFVRLQRTKAAIVESAEKLNAQQETALSDIEEIWNNLLRVQDIGFDPGSRLYDIDRVLSHLERSQTEFVTGVKVLDALHINPARATLTMVLAASGRGKTWALVNIGRHALMQRKKVLHITCEVSADDVVMRYWQNLFSISKRAVPKDTPLRVTQFLREEGKHGYPRLKGFKEVNIRPDFSIDGANAKTEIEAHLSWLGLKQENLIVKKFPMRSLTMPALRAYIDNLEISERFIPDMLILDAPYLMKIPEKEYRIHLGRMVESVRGLCEERSIAGIGAHQLSRQGAEAAMASVTHIAEDWSIVATADNIVILSSTDAEFNVGLMRGSVPKARAERDKFQFVMTQNYTIGQFCIDSMLMDSEYKTLSKKYLGEESDDDAGDEDDE